MGWPPIAFWVDTVERLFTSAVAVGDDYIGVYPQESVAVTSGAWATLNGLVFCDNRVYLNNGGFTSYTGTQTGLHMRVS